MSYEEGIEQILRGVKTRQSQVKLLMQLEELSNAIFKTEGNSWENSLQKTVSGDVAEIISELISGGEGPKVIMRKIIDAVKNIQALKITLAVNPSKEMVDQIYHWMDKNLPAVNILEIEVDERLMGGAKISYLGKYGDYSIQSRFEDYWNSKIKDERGI